MLPIDSVTRQPGEGGAAGHRPSPAAPLAMRAVLDTNTVLDWLVFADEAARAVGTAIAQRRLRWLATTAMLAELQAVLARPLPPRWQPARELALTIDFAQLACLCAEPALDPRHPICRDASDQKFIDLALQQSPTVLLTRDRALLALRRKAAALGVEVATAAAWRPRLDALAAQHAGLETAADP